MVWSVPGRGCIEKSAVMLVVCRRRLLDHRLLRRVQVGIGVVLVRRAVNIVRVCVAYVGCWEVNSIMGYVG